MSERFTEEQLNKLDTQVLITMILSLQERNEELVTKIDKLAEQNQKILEQIALSNKARFGRSSEKLEDKDQLRFVEIDGEICFFNEAEAVCDLSADEPEDITVREHSKKRKGKRAEDLKDLPVRRVDHYLSEEELRKEFGENGWKQLDDTVSKHYIFIPAKVEVEEHHIGVYASKSDGHVIRVPHPKNLLKGSLVSPSIAASFLNAKYVNAMPFYRQEKEYERYGLSITRQNMANWTIRLAEEYFGIWYDYVHEKLYDYHVIQADETPVLVNRDGRKAGSKSYMWVYRSGHLYKDKHIVLYEYQMTRNASHPLEFLKDFEGICLTDGYQVYHTAEKQLETLKIAGCWAHARRKVEEALDLIPKSMQKNTDAFLIMKQIQAIYREEGKLGDIDPESRLNQRQLIIAPLVDALFKHLKDNYDKASKGRLFTAYKYFLNQERYLRVFLEDGDVPIDNNAAERAIRGFCVGKKNWNMIDTINGAKSSAIIYSIAETAKANDLKTYEYFQFLLQEIPKHLDDTDRSFMEDLLPWSDKLPMEIRKKK